MEKTVCKFLEAVLVMTENTALNMVCAIFFVNHCIIIIAKQRSSRGAKSMSVALSQDLYLWAASSSAARFLYLLGMFLFTLYAPFILTSLAMELI